MQSVHSKRQSRKVDLAGLQALCAANYARLRKLLPRLDADNEDSFIIDVAGEQGVAVRVLERGPYTTIIDIKQQTPFALWAKAPHFQVRLYHDARMAEVFACQRGRHFRPRYDYPNKSMYQRDEKFQVNRFFSEWLGVCLSNGRPGQTFSVNTNVVN